MDFKPLEEIYRLIPHRPPFLWVDRIVHRSEESITTETFIRPDLELFSGHYPGNPILPGVIICEAVFQSGALLIASVLAEKDEIHPGRVPVLTRITSAKFKRMVRPEETIRTEVRIDDRVNPAWFLSAKVRVEDKLAMQISFACTLTE